MFKKKACAARPERAKRTFVYIETLSEARTKLVTFFNNLLVLRSKCHYLGFGQSFKIFVRQLHQFSMGTSIKRNILILC